MQETTTRDHIVAAADQLFYQQGYEQTSFSDIADAVKISRGNFYYHFKTKDEILDAVITVRLARTQAMLAQWESEAARPQDGIRRFIDMLLANSTPIQRYGCPVGTLCTELAKLNHASRSEAQKLFMLFRQWLRRQFTLAGFEPEADALAMHLLVLSQGIATLANAFHDEQFIKQEVAHIHAWLESCTATAARKAAG